MLCYTVIFAPGMMRKDLYCRNMTVARIRFRGDQEPVEVLFLESARIYHLLKNNDRYYNILKKLEDASFKKESIRVCFVSIESDVIEEVR